VIFQSSHDTLLYIRFNQLPVARFYANLHIFDVIGQNCKKYLWKFKFSSIFYFFMALFNNVSLFTA